MKTSTLNYLKAGAAPFALGLAILAGPALAQDAAPQAASDAPEDQTIVVTGSRISRPDLKSASPVAVVSADQLRLSNKPGVEEFVRQLPQAVPGTGQNNNNGNPGVATINLRNLGEVRTLVLVDGHRFVPYDAQGIVDLNMIPSALIKRIEVVTGGASAVYGSDAVAGVVNIILNDKFEGLEGNAQTGISSRGDGRQSQLSLTGGISLGDRGHLIVSGSYTNVDKVDQGKRDYSRFGLASADFSPGGSSTNAFGSIDTPDGRYTFTPNGFVPYSGARDSFNFNPYNLLQVPQEKWTATALADYELTDNVEFFGRFSYGKSKVRTEIAPSGIFASTLDINYRDNPYFDPATNPAAVGARAFLSQYDNGTGNDAVADDGIVTLGIRRRLTELGPRISDYNSEAWQAVGGFRGDIGAHLKWEVFAQYGKSIRHQAFLNDVSLTKAQQAILVVNGPNGPQCLDPSGGCVPANLWGIGNTSAEAAKFMAFGVAERDTNDQFVAGGFISGDLPVSISSGHPAAFVLGAEYRREKGLNDPNLDYILGNAGGFGSSSRVNAKYNVKEIYGELKVPLASDQPFLQTLGLEAGFRYSNYHNSTTIDTSPLDGQINRFSNSFTNWTYKIGADWAPIQAVRFRAMFQRAVRAPNLQEIGLPRTQSVGDAAFDPCGAGVYDPSDATLHNLCATVGGGMTESQIGHTDQPTSGQVNNFSGGNPNLVPEVANTLTIGAVIEPAALPGFTASIDYFDIKVKKAILATPEQAIIDACYYAERDANGTFCSLITRDPSTGTLDGDQSFGVDATKRNIGLLRSRGIDVKLNWNVGINDDTRLLLGLSLTRQLKSQVQFADVLKVYNCVGSVGKTCLNPDPKWRWIQTTGIQWKEWLLQGTWRHMSSLANDSLSVGYNFNPPSAFVVPYIKPYDYVDLSVKWEINDRFSFRAGVDNVFDRQPPVVGSDYGGTVQNSGNTFPATYDALGRYFNVGVTFKLF